MKVFFGLILLAMLPAKAEHWKLYCNGTEVEVLKQFDPVAELDGRTPVFTPEYPYFKSLDPEKKEESIKFREGGYTNLCTGSLYKGWGKPTPLCATYCKGALNMMKAITTAIETHSPQEVTKFRPACAIPPGDTIGMLYPPDKNQECTACNIRAYNKKVQAQLENCLVTYDAYVKTLGSIGGSGPSAGGAH